MKRESESIKQLERILRGFGNDRRLRIIQVLIKEKELSVGDVSKQIKLSFTATSKHLNALYKLDILDRRQKSLVVYYRISNNISGIVRFIIMTISNLRE
jgi:DNA-binding transcriptional ArsR family regulator